MGTNVDTYGCHRRLWYKRSSRNGPITKKLGDSIKKKTMPATLRIGSEVSSVTSSTSRLVDPPPGKKRRVRERVYGVIMRSVVGGMWEVRWASGAVECISPKKLKLEGNPTPETEALVERYHRRQ